jgi:hypothetical protein
MRDTDYIAIPLRRRDGTVRAYAKIDYEDAALAGFRWCLHSKGYPGRIVCAGGCRETIRLNRVILALAPGDGLIAEHIARDPLNNRRANLRAVTHGQNMQNRDANGSSTSRYRGVHWSSRRGMWVAQAGLDGHVHWLGYHDSEEEAAMAARRFREEHMPYTVES